MYSFKAKYYDILIGKIIGLYAYTCTLQSHIKSMIIHYSNSITYYYIYVLCYTYKVLRCKAL